MLNLAKHPYIVMARGKPAFLMLNLAKHPYIVMARGKPVARFSNLKCAARSALWHQGIVTGPESLDNASARDLVTQLDFEVNKYRSNFAR